MRKKACAEGSAWRNLPSELFVDLHILGATRRRHFKNSATLFCGRGKTSTTYELHSKTTLEIRAWTGGLWLAGWLSVSPTCANPQTKVCTISTCGADGLLADALGHVVANEKLSVPKCELAPPSRPTISSEVQAARSPSAAHGQKLNC